MRILVVDDDKRLLEEVGAILTRHGHVADCAESAEAGLVFLGANRYDFVLVDYRMPGHDGIWFMTHASLPRQTKALLVTSYVDRTVLKQMFEVGIAGYVMKPFDEAELLLHLDFHLKEARTEQTPGAKRSRA